MGLAPVALGMVGLQFALFVHALWLFGADADEQQAGPPLRSIGAVGSLLAAVSLLFMALWFLIGAPLGTEGSLPQVQLTFSLVAGIYGLLWLGVAVVEMKGWDMRPLGNAALIGAIMTVVSILVIAGWGLNTHLALVELVLVAYTLVLLGFWGVTHGKFSAKGEAWLLLLAVVGTFYLQFWASGILPAPQ